MNEILIEWLIEKIYKFHKCFLYNEREGEGKFFWKDHLGQLVTYIIEQKNNNLCFLNNFLKFSKHFFDIYISSYIISCLFKYKY